MPSYLFNTDAEVRSVGNQFAAGIRVDYIDKAFDPVFGELTR